MSTDLTKLQQGLQELHKRLLSHLPEGFLKRTEVPGSLSSYLHPRYKALLPIQSACSILANLPLDVDFKGLPDEIIWNLIEQNEIDVNASPKQQGPRGLNSGRLSLQDCPKPSSFLDSRIKTGIAPQETADGKQYIIESLPESSSHLSRQEFGRSSKRNEEQVSYAPKIHYDSVAAGFCLDAKLGGEQSDASFKVCQANTAYQELNTEYSSVVKHEAVSAYAYVKDKSCQGNLEEKPASSFQLPFRDDSTSTIPKKQASSFQVPDSKNNSIYTITKKQNPCEEMDLPERLQVIDFGLSGSLYDSRFSAFSIQDASNSVAHSSLNEQLQKELITKGKDRHELSSVPEWLPPGHTAPTPEGLLQKLITSSCSPGKKVHEVLEEVLPDVSELNMPTISKLGTEVTPATRTTSAGSPKRILTFKPNVSNARVKPRDTAASLISLTEPYGQISSTNDVIGGQHKSRHRGFQYAKPSVYSANWVHGEHESINEDMSSQMMFPERGKCGLNARAVPAAMPDEWRYARSKDAAGCEPGPFSAVMPYDRRQTQSPDLLGSTPRDRKHAGSVDMAGFHPRATAVAIPAEGWYARHTDTMVPSIRGLEVGKSAQRSLHSHNFSHIVQRQLGGSKSAGFKPRLGSSNKLKPYEVEHKDSSTQVGESYLQRKAFCTVHEGSKSRIDALGRQPETDNNIICGSSEPCRVASQGKTRQDAADAAPSAGSSHSSLLETLPDVVLGQTSVRDAASVANTLGKALHNVAEGLTGLSARAGTTGGTGDHETRNFAAGGVSSQAAVSDIALGKPPLATTEAAAAAAVVAEPVVESGLHEGLEAESAVAIASTAGVGQGASHTSYPTTLGPKLMEATPDPSSSLCAPAEIDAFMAAWDTHEGIKTLQSVSDGCAAQQTSISNAFDAVPPAPPLPNLPAMVTDVAAATEASGNILTVPSVVVAASSWKAAPHEAPSLKAVADAQHSVSDDSTAQQNSFVNFCMTVPPPPPPTILPLEDVQVATVAKMQDGVFPVPGDIVGASAKEASSQDSRPFEATSLRPPSWQLPCGPQKSMTSTIELTAVSDAIRSASVQLPESTSVLRRDLSTEACNSDARPQLSSPRLTESLSSMLNVEKTIVKLPPHVLHAAGCDAQQEMLLHECNLEVLQSLLASPPRGLEVAASMMAARTGTPLPPPPPSPFSPPSFAAVHPLHIPFGSTVSSELPSCVSLPILHATRSADLQSTSLSLPATCSALESLEAIAGSLPPSRRPLCIPAKITRLQMMTPAEGAAEEPPPPTIPQNAARSCEATVVAPALPPDVTKPQLVRPTVAPAAATVGQPLTSPPPTRTQEILEHVEASAMAPSSPGTAVESPLPSVPQEILDSVRTIAVAPALPVDVRRFQVTRPTEALSSPTTAAAGVSLPLPPPPLLHEMIKPEMVSPPPPPTTTTTIPLRPSAATVLQMLRPVGSATRPSSTPPPRSSTVTAGTPKLPRPSASAVLQKVRSIGPLAAARMPSSSSLSSVAAIGEAVAADATAGKGATTAAAAAVLREIAAAEVLSPLLGGASQPSLVGPTPLFPTSASRHISQASTLDPSPAPLPSSSALASELQVASKASMLPSSPVQLYPITTHSVAESSREPVFNIRNLWRPTRNFSNQEELGPGYSANSSLHAVTVSEQASHRVASPVLPKGTLSQKQVPAREEPDLDTLPLIERLRFLLANRNPGSSIDAVRAAAAAAAEKAAAPLPSAKPVSSRPGITPAAQPASVNIMAAASAAPTPVETVSAHSLAAETAGTTAPTAAPALHARSAVSFGTAVMLAAQPVSANTMASAFATPCTAAESVVQESKGDMSSLQHPQLNTMAGTMPNPPESSAFTATSQTGLKAATEANILQTQDSIACAPETPALSHHVAQQSGPAIAPAAAGAAASELRDSGEGAVTSEVRDSAAAAVSMAEGTTVAGALLTAASGGLAAAAAASHGLHQPVQPPALAIDMPMSQRTAADPADAEFPNSTELELTGNRHTKQAAATASDLKVSDSAAVGPSIAAAVPQYSNGAAIDDDVSLLFERVPSSAGNQSEVKTHKRIRPVIPARRKVATVPETSQPQLRQQGGSTASTEKASDVIDLTESGPQGPNLGQDSQLGSFKSEESNDSKKTVPLSKKQTSHHAFPSEDTLPTCPDVIILEGPGSIPSCSYVGAEPSVTRRTERHKSLATHQLHADVPVGVESTVAWYNERHEIPASGQIPEHGEHKRAKVMDASHLGPDGWVGSAGNEAAIGARLSGHSGEKSAEAGDEERMREEHSFKVKDESLEHSAGHQGGPCRIAERGDFYDVVLDESRPEVLSKERVRSSEGRANHPFGFRNHISDGNALGDPGPEIVSEERKRSSRGRDNTADTLRAAFSNERRKEDASVDLISGDTGFPEGGSPEVNGSALQPGNSVDLSQDSTEMQEWQRRHEVIAAQRSEAQALREEARRAREQLLKRKREEEEVASRLRQRLEQHKHMETVQQNESAAKERVRLQVRQKLQRVHAKSLSRRDLVAFLAEIKCPVASSGSGTTAAVRSEAVRRALKTAKVRYHPDKVHGGLEQKVHAEEVCKILNSWDISRYRK